MDPDVIPSPEPTETNRILSGGWMLQDPIESGIGLMDLENWFNTHTVLNK
jgi:hypothetical protein